MGHGLEEDLKATRGPESRFLHHESWCDYVVMVNSLPFDGRLGKCVRSRCGLSHATEAVCLELYFVMSSGLLRSWGCCFPWRETHRI